MELSDEAVARTLRENNYLVMPGFGRDVNGQGMLRISKVVQFQPEAKRLAILLAMMGGWEFSGDLLLREGDALAFLVPVEGQIPFEPFPHDKFAKLVEATEIAGNLKADDIARENEVVPEDIFMVAEGTKATENSSPVRDAPSDGSGCVAAAAEVDLVKAAASDASIARLNELLGDLGIKQDALDQQLVALSSIKPTTVAVVERADGSTRPLTLPPTEMLRTRTVHSEPKALDIVGVVVMIDLPEQKARLHDGRTIFLEEGISDLRCNQKYLFKTTGHVRVEKITITPVSVEEVLEDDLMTQVKTGSIYEDIGQRGDAATH